MGMVWVCDNFSVYNLEMSFRANVDIVIALNALRITSFRKQGRLRFRLSLLRTPHPQTQNTKNVRSSQIAAAIDPAAILRTLQHIQIVPFLTCSPKEEVPLRQKQSQSLRE